MQIIVLGDLWTVPRCVEFFWAIFARAGLEMFSDYCGGGAKDERTVLLAREETPADTKPHCYHPQFSAIEEGHKRL